MQEDEEYRIEQRNGYYQTFRTIMKHSNSLEYYKTHSHLSNSPVFVPFNHFLFDIDWIVLVIDNAEIVKIVMTEAKTPDEAILKATEIYEQD